MAFPENRLRTPSSREPPSEYPLTGDDNNREVVSHLEQLRLDIQSTHAGQADIQQHATCLECLGCRQKCIRIVEGDRLETGGTQQTLQRTKHGDVVVQNVDGSFSHLPLHRTEG